MLNFAADSMGINKKFRYFVAVLLASMLVALPHVLYADTGTWVDGDLPVLTVGDQVANAVPAPDCFPTSFTYHSYTKPNGLFDSIGRDIDQPVCATQNQLGYYGGSGFADNSGFVKPGTNYAFQVFNAHGDASGVTPVPNQPTFITGDSSQSFNGEVAPHFYDSFPSAGTFGPAGQQLAFTVNQPGTILTDSVGAKIYMFAHAFSRNGQWMVLEARSLGIVRVNTQTRAMQLFDPTRLTYGQGYRPQMALAISDDGNYVVKSGGDAGNPAAYDLSGCKPGSFTIGVDNTSAMQGCRTRYLYASLRAQLPNFSFLTNMQFSGDGKEITAIAVQTGTGGSYTFHKATYAVAGYQPPHTTYIALGDSFSSGEGAYNYELGTNDPLNLCHLSKLSYPYISAKALGITDFHSVACSGAKTGDYFRPQIAAGTDITWPLGAWEPGISAQQLYLLQSGAPSVMTMSMIGNDIGFKDKLMQCLSPLDTCFHFQNDRKSIADEIYGKFDTLTGLYTDIKNDSGNRDNVELYVLGYPQIMGTGPTCSLNVPFNQEERQMAHGLVSYLDAVIKAATIKAGAQYIDVENAFAGHMLCDDGVQAVNGLSIDNDVPDLLSKANASFHPNALGHQLMSQALLAQSQNFSVAMPAANSSKIAPYAESAEYTAFMNGAPAGGTLSHLVYEGSSAAGLLLKGSNASLDITDHLLQQNAPFQVWFYSTPTLAGTLTSDSQGRLTGSVAVPDSLLPGYHMTHVLGKDIAGQDIDLYQEVYVAASADDLNGDGVPNGQDQCLLVPASGVDQDRDGIDDACDPEITAPPADTVSPQVTGAAGRDPDHGGWYNHDVTITWVSTDSEPSSGVPTQPAPTNVNEDGDVTYASQPSCDPAGNCRAGSLELKLDKTPPSINVSLSPQPNPQGWSNGPVTVTFTCADATSGIAQCAQPVTVNDDGTYVVTGSATDIAGNTSEVNAIVSIDATSPTVMNTVSPVPNAQGWNNSDVAITSDCSDALSGVASCSTPVQIAAEGANQLVAGVAVDNAGNEATATTRLNIDKTAPVIAGLEWSANPKATTQASTLTVHATDTHSGVVRAEYFLGDADPGIGSGASLQAAGNDFTATMGADFPSGVYKVTVRAEDAAGNWSALTSDYLVVYNPFSVRVTGKRFIAPSLASNDTLPGLIDPAQTDTAKFGFSIGYDALGRMLPNSDVQLSYTTGLQCNKPAQAQNCHSLALDSTSVFWLTTQGVNNSIGMAEGSARLVVDGITQQVLFVLTASDGEAHGVSGDDHLKLSVYRAGDSPFSSAPLYQVDDNVVRGTIHIKT